MRFEMAVIGASLGGLGALETILKGLGENFPLPAAVVQHRGRGPGGNLRKVLQETSSCR